MSKQVEQGTAIRTVGGFDNGPCHLCAREEPCKCGPYTPETCACTCGRCQYPFPLPDDGRDHG